MNRAASIRRGRRGRLETGEDDGRAAKADSSARCCELAVTPAVS